MKAEKLLVENVKVGDIFTTQNKFFTTLGRPNQKGNQAKATLTEAQRYLRWELTGRTKNEFEIVEIYDTPLEKSNNHGGARPNSGHKWEGHYFIEQSLFRILSEQHRTSLVTKSELMELVGMVSSRKDLVEIPFNDALTNEQKDEIILYNHFVADIKNKFTNSLNKFMNEYPEYIGKVLIGWNGTKKGWNDRFVLSDEEVGVYGECTEELLKKYYRNNKSLSYKYDVSEFKEHHLFNYVDLYNQFKVERDEMIKQELGIKVIIGYKMNKYDGYFDNDIQNRVVRKCFKDFAYKTFEGAKYSKSKGNRVKGDLKYKDSTMIKSGIEEIYGVQVEEDEVFEIPTRINPFDRKVTYKTVHYNELKKRINRRG